MTNSSLRALGLTTSLLAPVGVSASCRTTRGRFGEGHHLDRINCMVTGVRASGKSRRGLRVVQAGVKILTVDQGPRVADAQIHDHLNSLERT